MKLLLSIFIFSTTIFSQSSITGQLRDLNSGELIESAGLYINSDYISSSNRNGYINIKTNLDPPFRLRINHISYKDTTINITSKSTNLIIKLIPQFYTDSTEIIQPRVQAIQPVYIRMSEMKDYAKFGGEVDIIKNLQLISGVSPSGELRSGFHVRGGMAQHNSVYIDNVKLYGYQHFFNLFSAFNASSVKSLNLYKSLIPSELSGNLSSVLRLNLKDGHQKKWQGEGNISLLSSQIELDGPISFLNSTIMISGRRTYADIIAKEGGRIYANANDYKFKDDGDLFFYDTAMKITSNISSKSSIQTSFFYSKDVFEIKSGTFNNWHNSALSINYRNILNSNMTIENTLSYSEFDYEFFYNLNNSFRFRRQFIKNRSLKTQLNYNASESFNLQAGMRLENEKVNYEDNFNKSSVKSNADIYNYLFFADLSYQLSRNTKIQLNLPITWYKNKTAFTEEEFRFVLLHNDSINYYSFGLYRNKQFLHSISYTEQEDPNRLLLPSSKFLKPEILTGLSFSYNRVFNHFDLKTEAYYQEFENTPLLKRSELIISEENIDIGTMKSLGIDIDFTYRYKDLLTKISYSYSNLRSEYKDINFGKEFEPGYNKLHKLNGIISYFINDNWKLNFSIHSGSGALLTIPTDKLFIGNQSVYFFGQKNNYRIPYTYRVDVGFTYYFSTNYANFEFNLNLYNILNSHNPFVYGYSLESSEVVTASLGFFPTFGLSFYF
jgi:hypothetical protein